MNLTTFLAVYLSALVACVIITLGIIRAIKPGLKKYFCNLIQDTEISGFFVRLISLILFLGGLSAALNNNYVVDKATWLTLSWDAVDQLKGTLDNLFSALIVFSISFLIIELLQRRFTK